MKFSRIFGRTGVILSTLFLAVGAANTAEAANWNTCEGDPQKWNSNYADMALNTTSFPVGGYFDLAMQSAMNKWNDIGGSAMRFILARNTAGTVSRDNGVNEVYFEGENGALAVTYQSTRCYWYWWFGTRWRKGFQEADIGFNSTKEWGSGAYDPAATWINFDAVANHELGHAQGLEHTKTSLATMNEYYPVGGPTGLDNRFEIHADDRNGARILYGDGSAKRDVAASRWGYDATSNENTNWRLRSTGYPGGLQNITFTMENRGNQAETVHVYFYASINNYISSYDYYLGSSVWSMPAGSTVNNGVAQVTLPFTLPHGTYFLGYIIDAPKYIPESQEENNFIARDGTVTIY